MIGMNAPVLGSKHHQLDLAVDRLYLFTPFTSDEEHQEHLFKLCEEMGEQESNGLNHGIH
jgi:hypothetical protein